MEAVANLARNVSRQLGRIVVGQEGLKRECLLVLLCEGHALLEGVPGVAKTLTVKALCRILGLRHQRVQCTADLMPGDIIGTTIASLATGSFDFRKGPVFTDILLVDEVNRMPPRTQASLLECMEERQVTMDGTRYPLSDQFAVFATQNPIEFEGTYPLPEAQLDRFLVKIRVPYLSLQDETQLLETVHGGFDARAIDQQTLDVIPADVLREAREEVRRVTVEASLFSYIAAVIRRTRESPAVSLGASPRAGVALLMVSKAVAAMDGRAYLIPDDVKAAVPSVLRHRLVLKPEADLEGMTPDHLLQEICRSVEVPR